METTRAKKKTTNTKKKSNNTMRLTKEEKELVKAYRKCNILEKKIIKTLCEKASSDIEDIISSLRTIQ